MKIDSIMVGPIMTNCYLLSDETAGVCALIDPGDEPDRVLDMVSRSGCALQCILLTHGHFDHTTAVRPILEQYHFDPVFFDIAKTGRHLWVAIYFQIQAGSLAVRELSEASQVINQTVSQEFQDCTCELILKP